MFETFNVPAMYVAIQAVLSLYASGRTTGQLPCPFWNMFRFRVQENLSDQTFEFMQVLFLILVMGSPTTCPYTRAMLFLTPSCAWTWPAVISLTTSWRSWLNVATPSWPLVNADTIETLSVYLCCNLTSKYSEFHKTAMINLDWEYSNLYSTQVNSETQTFWCILFGFGSMNVLHKF